MFNPSYLALSRNRVWYFRWPIPRALHPEGKPSTIKVSLRTREPREALRLSRLFGYAAPVIAAHEAAKGMRYADIRNTLHQHFSALLAGRRKQMDEHGPLDPLDVNALENGASFASEALEGRTTLSLGADDTALLARFIEKYRLPISTGSTGYDHLQRGFYTAYRDYCATVLRENDKLGRYEYGDDVQRQETLSCTVPSQTLGQTITEFIERKNRLGEWAGRTNEQNTQYLEVLKELLGADTSLGALSAREARHVEDSLLKLPRNAAKNPATRGKSLSELLSDQHSGTLSRSTVNSYLRTYKGLFQWACDGGLMAVNPFAKVRVKQNKNKDDGRDAFTLAQLQAIENALLGKATVTAPTEAHKWATLILMYTGARLNEVCQLTLDDVAEHESILCFEFNDEGDKKSVKNVSSRRIVPVHSRLIELGIVAYIERIKKRGSSRLFPEFSYSVKHGWGRNVSVWVNTRLLVQLQIKSKSRVLHSFRHTMYTYLKHADVQETLAKAVLGHAQAGVSQLHYFKSGYKFRQLQEALEKFTLYPVKEAR